MVLIIPVWQTCSIWGNVVQLDGQGVAGLSVVLQSMAIASAPIKEPLATEHCSIRQVQPQVLSHLTLLTLPTTGNREADVLFCCVVFNLIIFHHVDMKESRL